MSAAVCYFLVYFAEALILLQYSSNVFEYKISSIKRYILLTVLFIPIYFISFAHIGLLNTALFFVATFVFLKISTMENSATLFFHSAIMIVIMTLCELASMGIFSKFSYHFYSKMNDTVLLYSVSFLSKLLYFVIIYFISHKLSSTRSNIRFSIYEITTLAIIPVISVFVIYTMIYFLMNYKIKSPLNYLLILSSFFMLLINILIFGLFEHIKQKNSEIAELTLQNQRDADSVEYYKAIVSQDEKQKVLIHDIKKHLNAIASLNEQHDSEKIAAYLTHVLGSSELKHSVRVCDNDLLNALLCRYQKICLTQNIALHIDIRSKCIDFVTYDDLSVLFGNLMDNAVESAEKTVNPFIELNVFQKEKNNMTIITLIDSCRVNPIDKNGNLLPTKKPNPQFHGFGMRSIENIVKKCNGEMTFYFDDPTKTFHTIIMLRH